MRLHKLFLLLITAFLTETAAFISVSLEISANAKLVQSNQPEWYLSIEEDSGASSSLLPASTGIESPLENHHLLEKGPNCKSVFNFIRLARNLRVTYWNYSSSCKINRYENSWPFNSGQYPSIPIAFRKLLI